MALKMECHSRWNVTQNGMALKIECHLKWNVTQNGISLKCKATKNEISLKSKYHSKLNVTQKRMSLKRAVNLKISQEEWDYCFHFLFLEVLDFIKYV